MFLITQRYFLLLILTLFVTVLSLAYFTVFRDNRERYIKFWGASWIMYGFSLVFNIILISQPTVLLLIAGKQFFDLLNSLFLLAGTYAFLGRKLPAYWVQFTAVNVIWILLAYYYHLSFLMITLLASIYFSIVALINGVMLQSSLTRNPLSRGVVIAVFLFWGAYKAYYPYLYPAFQNSSIGYSVELILANLMNLSIMMIYLRRIREELDKSEGLFRVFAENAQDMIFVYRIAPAMHYLYVSPACKNILGYGQDYFYQNNLMLASITHPDDRVYLDALFDPSVELTEPITVRLQHKDGHYLWTEQKTTFIRNEEDNTIQVEGILRDITDRKKVEEELLQTEQARLSLLANVSHELRTPVTSIVGYISMLRDGRNLEKLEETLDFLYRKSLHLQRLVQDLFQLTQLDSGRQYFNFSHITIRELLEQTVEKYRIDITEKGYEFRLDHKDHLEYLERYLIVDVERIDQVFSNLIYNAMKFTPAGGQIQIRLGLMMDPEEVLLASIEDTGIGMGPEELEHVFERFYRSPSRESSKEGSGLGLAISKEIVEHHHGRIWVESEPGQGSSFHFTIPIY